MTDNMTFDNQLAEYTDALLRGDSPSVPGSLEAEARTIRLLKRTIAPDESVSPAFQTRLNDTLNAELSKRQSQKRNKRSPFNITPLHIYQISMAAALAVVVAIVAIVGFGSGDPLRGSADGSLTTTFAVFAVSFALILALWIGYSKRQ